MLFIPSWDGKSIMHHSWVNYWSEMHKSGKSSGFNAPAVQQWNHSQLESNSMRSTRQYLIITLAAANETCKQTNWNKIRQVLLEKPLNFLLMLSCAKAPEVSRITVCLRSKCTCVSVADVHRHWAAYWGWLIFHRLSRAVLEEVTLPKTDLAQIYTHQWALRDVHSTPRQPSKT